MKVIERADYVELRISKDRKSITLFIEQEPLLRIDRVDLFQTHTSEVSGYTRTRTWQLRKDEWC